MNGSKGADFKEAATAERTHKMRQQSLSNEARNMEGSAKLIQQRYTGHADIHLRQTAIHAAASLNNAAHALRILRDRENTAFNNSIEKDK